MINLLLKYFKRMGTFPLETLVSLLVTGFTCNSVGKRSLIIITDPINLELIRWPLRS